MTEPDAIDNMFYQSSTREILAWFFGQYFDGESHVINGANYTCPDCEVTCAKSVLARLPTKPRIYIDVTGVGQKIELRCSSTGRTARSNLFVKIYVIAPAGRGAATAGERTIEEVQGLIEWLLTIKAPDLKLKNLRFIGLDTPITYDDDERKIAVSVRSATFQITRSYTRDEP